jgi:RNA polymerase sigma factor (sigma-70 family)
MLRQSSGSILHYINRIACPEELWNATDSQLLERFVERRNEDAFALLVRRHGPMVLGICQRALSQPQDVEDAFQATFLVLVRKASRIGRRHQLSNWLFGVALRTAAKARGQSARRHGREVSVPDVPEREVFADPAVQSIRPILDEEIARLPARYRAPVTLCYLEGRTNEEAARQLGCPKGTLQYWLACARDRLRHRLNRRGITLPASVFGPRFVSDFITPSVPPALVRSTTRMAVTSGLRDGTGVAISASATRLADAVLHTALITMARGVAVLLLVGLLIGTGAWTGRPTAVGPVIPSVAADVAESRASEQPAVKADQRAAKLDQPTPKVERDDGHFTAKAVTTKSFKTGASPRVIVETFNGHIEVHGGADRKVDATVTRRCDARTQAEADKGLDNIDVTMTQEGDAIRIKARLKAETHREDESWGAPAELRLPTDAVVQLETNNGHVKIDGARSSVRAKTTNGSVVVSNGAGRMDLHTVNGAIDVKADKATVAAQTQNGSVRFAGTLADGAHTLHTTNGSVHVALPADTPFSVEAETHLGHIHNDFSSEHGTKVGLGAHWHGDVGPNPRINLKLDTTNGAISITKKKQ